MSSLPEPDGELPTVPVALVDRMFALLFGDPERRAEAFAQLVAANPEHAEALHAHFRRQLEMEGGEGGPAEPADATVIPGYRLLSVLGEGGMGTVWRAEQVGPVHRLVALKVVKPGMDSKAVLARFEQERQALAAMDHDAIAKVFDCGTTPRGQPFFAMELVEGLPIQRYCDDRRLPLKQRIELFQQVCQGVQHAHLKGVIHRDLKPGNVLVVAQEGRHAVKIIDFGVARATDRRLAVGSLFTEEGMIVGTPEYMSPEQAAGDVRRIDMRTDVYSLGVILYELLVGELPFPGAELRAAALAEVQRRLCEDEPPKPSTRLSTMGAAAMACAARRGISADALRRELVGDLDWVVLKAMAKEPERRYESPTALAEDLRRYLVHEPLVAGPPSAGYRLRKLVRRYRGRIVAGSAVFATAVVGAVVALQFALREREKVRQFDLLSGVVLYDRAIEAEKELYPPWPHKIAAMEKWLREDCGQLLAMRPEIERRVVGLRAVALPATPAEIDQDRRLHPRFGEWALLQKRVSALNRAQAVREGRQELEVPALPFDMRERAASDLNDLAWDRVAPKPDERKTYGDEALGLALAKAALARVEAGDNSVEPCAVLDTLAWALFQNGRDDEARQRSAAALALAPVDERDGTRGNDNDLAQSIAEARGTLMAAEKRLRTLTEETSERRTFTFADDARRFLHDAVTDLRARLDGLAAKEKPAVEQQLAWARRIDELTRHHPNARVTWEAAAEAIAKADQVAASELYRAHPIEHLPPQMGLVPIGRNPRTKLWEFYELRSAWDGKSDPATIAIPEHREDGSIEVAAETGIVFVLLPGGVFTMGAQSQDEDKANFDARAKNDETPQRITLAPFLMARHELTRAQWQRLTGTSPFWFKENTTVGYEGDPIPIGPSHPAESMSANEASLWMERHGLVLPTEAQWEYACRAVTTTPWWPGREEADLEGAANVHDRTSFSRQPQWGTSTPIEDGFTAIAPVGSFRANAFGLFDTHGNLFEMCRDWYSIHGIAWQPVDGLRLGGESSGFRVCRGGSYADHSVGARCAFRQPLSPSMATQQTGIRVARTLELEP